MSSTNTALNVSTGKPRVTGGIYRAPVGTAAPTDATTALSGSFVPLGYISTDGVTQSSEIDSGEYKAWGGDVVLAYVNGKTYRFAFSMIEVLNPELYKTLHGVNNVSGTLATGMTIRANGTDTVEWVYVIELAMRDGAFGRIVIPDGKITEMGDTNFQDDDAIAYPVTITCQSDNNGIPYYEYIIKQAST